MSDTFLVVPEGTFARVWLKPGNDAGLSHNGINYRRYGADLGAMDVLRRKDGRLGGFCLWLNPATAEPLKALLACHNVTLDDGLLFVHFLPLDSLEIICVQAIGTSLYLAEDGQILISLPLWGIDAEEARSLVEAVTSLPETHR